MEKELYSFGVMKIAGEEVEFVRVKSTSPDSLTPGFHSVVEEYPDSIITHEFKVREQFDAKEAEGEYYKWYLLESHNRTIDRSPAAIRMAAQNAANLDYLSMMAGIDLPESEVSGNG